MRDVEHQQHRDGENDIAQDHERPEFAESGLGLVDDVTDDRVGKTVEDPGGRSQRADDDNKQTGDPCRVISGKSHSESVKIRCRIV